MDGTGRTAGDRMGHRFPHGRRRGCEEALAPLIGIKMQVNDDAKLRFSNSSLAKKKHGWRATVSESAASDRKKCPLSSVDWQSEKIPFSFRHQPVEYGVGSFTSTPRTNTVLRREPDRLRNAGGSSHCRRSSSASVIHSIRPRK